MMIYKIFRAEEWDEMLANGETGGSRLDVTDGFIHFSTDAQVRETVEKHFAGEDGLMLAGVDETAVEDALKWEPAREGQLFPHLYRRLMLKEVSYQQEIPLGPEGHEFPEGFDELE